MPVLAFMPPKVVRTYQPRRVGGGGAGRRAGGALGGRLAPPRPPGRGGPYNPVLPAPTPFQPGANPAPLLGAWAMLGLGIGVLAKVLWEALNLRPGVGPFQPWKDGDIIESPTGQNATFQIFYGYRFETTRNDSCAGVPLTIPATETAAPVLLNTVAAQSVSLVLTKRVGNLLCGTGSNSQSEQLPLYRTRTAAGVETNWIMGRASTISYGFSRNLVQEVSYPGFFVRVNGQDLTGTPGQPLEFAPNTRPQAPVPAAAIAPFPAPAPAVPAPALLPATVPGSTPAPAPAPASDGLPAPAPAPAPAPTMVPTLTRTITRATPGSQPQTLTATGVTTAPAPAPITQTPAEAVLIGTTLIGGPGAAPPPGPAGTAAELGRIEKKMELALDRINPLAELADALALLGELLNLLEEPSPGGSYSIRPACGTDAQGNPLPVIEVPIAGGLGVVGAIVPRLDAIAELLDLHKQLRQPVCKGKPTGDPVTVTGVEID